jgi:hypothetical protein
MGAGISYRVFRRANVLARQIWRGWGDADVASLTRKLDDPAAYSGGIVKISVKEYRALAELNRSIQKSKLPELRSPLLA